MNEKPRYQWNTRHGEKKNSDNNVKKLMLENDCSNFQYMIYPHDLKNDFFFLNFRIFKNREFLPHDRGGGVTPFKS